MTQTHAKRLNEFMMQDLMIKVVIRFEICRNDDRRGFEIL